MGAYQAHREKQVGRLVGRAGLLLGWPVTLILSQASWRFAIQVGDRLVTRGPRPFDRIANKNILYFAPDAIISFGYTGPAYLAGVPTDQWLIEKLSGISYPRGARPGAFRFGTLPLWLPIGLALRILLKNLDSVLKRSAKFFELIGVGWQWGRRKRPRPVLVGLQKKPGARSVELWHAARHFGREYVFAATPDANADLLDREALLTRWRGIRSVDEAEQALVGAVRQVADQCPYVGYDCLSIVLPGPQYRMARVRYLPVKQEQAIVRPRKGPADGTVIPVAFSPWVIASMAVHAPSVLCGTHTLVLGDFQVSIEAPEPPSPGTQGAVSSVERPPEPH